MILIEKNIKSVVAVTESDEIVEKVVKMFDVVDEHIVVFSTFQYKTWEVIMNVARKVTGGKIASKTSRYLTSHRFIDRETDVRLEMMFPYSKWEELKVELMNHGEIGELMASWFDDEDELAA